MATYLPNGLWQGVHWPDTRYAAVLFLITCRVSLGLEPASSAPPAGHHDPSRLSGSFCWLGADSACVEAKWQLVRAVSWSPLWAPADWGCWAGFGSWEIGFPG